MKSETRLITTSPYFVPAFNSAIFDGPVRIYYAQHQEATALSLYVRLREMLGRAVEIYREHVNARRPNLFVLIYPDSKRGLLLFTEACGVEPRAWQLAADADSETDFIASEGRMGDDVVIGVTALAHQLHDRALDQISARIRDLLLTGLGDSVGEDLRNLRV